LKHVAFYYSSGEIDLIKYLNKNNGLDSISFFKKDGSRSVVEYPDFNGGADSLCNYLFAEVDKRKRSIPRHHWNFMIERVSFEIDREGHLQIIEFDAEGTDDAIRILRASIESMNAWRPYIRDGITYPTVYTISNLNFDTRYAKGVHSIQLPHEFE
jgi:hypothetical protein